MALVTICNRHDGLMIMRENHEALYDILLHFDGQVTYHIDNRATRILPDNPATKELKHAFGIIRADAEEFIQARLRKEPTGYIFAEIRRKLLEL